MNKKGFTLIELLAVIIMIGILGVLIVPSVLNTVEESKKTSYNTLIENIVTSSQTYYEECEYGDLSNTSKYGNYACRIDLGNSITTTLGALANTGFLKVKDTKEENGKEVKAVLNPTTNNDISSCQITIQKIKEEVVDTNGIKNIRVTYKVIGNDTNCPTTEEYEGVE